MNEQKCRRCGCILIENRNWANKRKAGPNCICKDCVSVYNANYREANRDEINKKQRENKYQSGAMPMSVNKECASYLGCYISENVLESIFNDVTRMPMNNPGFDFICNHGKRIDVKSSCIRNNKNTNDNWCYYIHKNKIPDYFLCLAFDNRDDLNPLYMWLIPRDVVCDLEVASISTKTMCKWSGFELSMDNVILQCDKMKGD